jgi:ABC-type amino acid transport substrate-binding protein
MAHTRLRKAAILACGGMLAVGLAAATGTASTARESAAAAQFHPPPIIGTVPPALKAACSASSKKIDEIKGRGTLNWAIGVSPPFGFKLANGQWAGIEAQNAAELAKILGVKFKITDYSYDVLPQTLVADKADIIGAQLFVTAERKKVIDFSTPYYKSGQLFYVLKSSPFQTIADLNKPSVHFVYGTGGAQLVLAKKYIPKAKITDAPLRGQLLLYDFLAAHQADATMTEAAPMKVIFDKFKNPPLAAIGLKGRVKGERAKPTEILSPFDVAFGLPKGDTGWTRCVNTWIKNMQTTGRLNKRLDYWLAQKVA